MTDMFRTPWGTTVARGPELVKALRSRYTVRYYIQRLNEDEAPFVLYGETYLAGDTFRAVDPEGFKQSYEDELETVASGEYDDVLSDIFGFERIQGSGNAKSGKCRCGKSRCTHCGKCGSENLMPGKPRKSSSRKTTAGKSGSKRRS